MFKHKISLETQTRRQLQRRIPPGTICVDSTDELFLVIGYAQHEQKTMVKFKTSFDDQPQITKEWMVIVLDSKQRIYTKRWGFLKTCLTVEEWESL